MKQKAYMHLLLILGLLFVLACQGCSGKPVINQGDSSINQDDLEAVNEYIVDNGANELSIDEAENINKLGLYKSKDTGEIKTIWQLVVDYVYSAQNGETESLGYSIKFENSSFSLENNETWEYIGS
jgi:hypothetical protein